LNTNVLDFERFWSAYPRKVAKGAARKKWESLIKGLDPEAIKEFTDEVIGSLDAQKKNRRELEGTSQFVPIWKHPTTWLNGECWNDEIKSIQEIRDESKGQKAKCACGQEAFFKTLCCRCFSNKYCNEGPTGQNTLRDAYKRSPARLSGESGLDYIGRVFGSRKNRSMETAGTVTGIPDTPDDHLSDPWETIIGEDKV
jgi:hypothetical protein